MSVLTNPLYNIEEVMNPTTDRWLEPENYRKKIRLNYIKTFQKPLPNYCPECGGPLTSTIDEDETICTECGLVTSASIEYVSVTKIILPYGRH